MKHITEVFYLLDIDETPLNSLNVLDFEKESIFEDINKISFTVPLEQELITEQQIIFREERFIITDITELRVANKKQVEAHSAMNELNDDNITTLSLLTLEFPVAIKRILDSTEWTVGHVDDDEGRLYTLEEEDVSPLYAINRLTVISDFFIVADTVHRILHFHKVSGRNLDFIMRYGKNITEIKRIITRPKATELKPLGRGGLTIESVNEGSDIIEDYSWYESLGIPLREARKRFRKRHVWKDERYIYAGNLMRIAQEKLRELSHPQITYETELLFIDKDAKVGDYGYVVDEELNINVQVRVVRLIEHKDETQNKIEMNYLIEGLETLQDEVGSSVSQTESEMIATYNQSSISINDNYTSSIELAFTSYAPTNMQIGLTITGEASQTTLLEGYLSIAGNRVGREIKQELNQGWNTISMSFLILQVEEGSDFLTLFLRVNEGTFSINDDDIELFIIAKNLLGGMSARLPKANVVEEVELPTYTLDVDENTNIDIQKPIDSSIIEYVQLPSERFDVTDHVTLIFDGIDYTNDPPAIPTGLTYTIGIGTIQLEWNENTEDFIAGYNVYLDGVKQNRNVIEDANYDIIGVEHGKDYNVGVTAISVWGVESAPYNIIVEMPSIPTSVIPIMTSNTTPEPFVASASSFYSDEFSAFKAFRKTNQDYWTTLRRETSGWLQIDLGEPTEVDFYTIQEARELNRNPRKWTLEGSNDENEWIVLDSQEGISWQTDEVKQFNLSEVVNYRYYRLNIEENNGHSEFLVVGEFDLFKN